MPSVMNSLSYTVSLRGNYESINSFVSRGLYLYTLIRFMHFIWAYSIRIKMSDNIQMNLGQKLSSGNKFSICHLNLNNIFAHSFIKLSLVRAYIFIHNFNI